MTPVASTPSPAPRNMEDRDCDARPRTAKSHHRLPKAGTFTNQRLPRSNSATGGGLTRRRSFQAKPLTTNAQAAQDGYYHRKAAKMYAEKRKAAAAAATSKENSAVEDPAKAAGLISVTVDHNGVKIDKVDDAKTATPANGGLGSRRNSRTRMSRSSSRRGSVRVEDKENAERPTPAQIDAYFARKRGEKETPAENTSWDGSMPQRQNSKSFIQRHPRPLDAKNVNSGPVKDVATSNPVEKRTEQSEEHRQRRRRASKKFVGHKRSGGIEEVQTSKTDVSTPAMAPSKQIEQPSVQETTRVLSVSDISETEAHSISSSPLQAPEKTPHTPPKDNESQSSGASSYKSTFSKAASCTSEASGSTDAGKWCNECAGVGLHIAALMSDLKKYRSHTDGATETTTPSKKGWKSTLLGGSDSKSKSQNEKSRMQHENTVLRATVEFLYKKIEKLENGGAVPDC